MAISRSKRKLSWGMLPVLAWAAFLGGCSDPVKRVTAESLVGCYVLDWSDIPRYSEAAMIPDSIMLTSELHRPDCCYGVDTLMVNLDARDARPVSAVADTAWSWKAVYRDHMWWTVQRDSILLGLGYGSYEFIRVLVEIRDTALSGLGFWESDAAGPDTIPLTGAKVPCP